MIPVRKFEFLPGKYGIMYMFLVDILYQVEEVSLYSQYTESLNHGSGIGMKN